MQPSVTQSMLIVPTVVFLYWKSTSSFQTIGTSSYHPFVRRPLTHFVPAYSPVVTRINFFAKIGFISQCILLLARCDDSSDFSTFLCLANNTIRQTLQNTILYPFQLLRSTQNAYHIAISWGFMLFCLWNVWCVIWCIVMKKKKISFLITRYASQKTLAITFPADCCVSERFSALSPGLTHYFDPSRDSGV